MSHTEDNEMKRPDNVVRLKIDGAKNRVNTLLDQQTGRGVSLVCPFPALEVDIPVRLGEGEGTTEGAIHRIGVEDDPRTGLPRLRLSIRTADARNTVIANTTKTLLDASRRELDEAPDATPTNERAEGPKVKPLVSWADALSEIETPPQEAPETSEAADQFSGHAEADPHWVDCGEMPLPEAFLQRSTTRRRYRMMKHMAVAFVLGMLVAAGYLLDRAGMVDFSEVSSSITAFYNGRDGVKETAEVETLAALSEAAPEDVDSTAPPSESVQAATAAVTPAVETASYGTGANPLLGDEAPPSTPVTVIEKAVTATEATPSEDESVATEAVESGETAAEDITLTLPTRWPVEYATAYRVRDPNGVVVDVPGGLVRREGWLEEGRENPLIRSVKAIQRESGARFVVYVNGDLPRFITSPKGTGVSLRLYYNKNVEDTATVAALDSAR